MKKYIVNILPFAEEDLYEIVSYFYNVNKDYANKLYSSLSSRIEELELFPEKGSIVPELEKQGFLKYHQLIEGNYRIIYSIIDPSVFVHLIVDSRRNLEGVLINKLQR